MFDSEFSLREMSDSPGRRQAICCLLVSLALHGSLLGTLVCISALPTYEPPTYGDIGGGRPGPGGLAGGRPAEFSLSDDVHDEEKLQAFQRPPAEKPPAPREVAADKIAGQDGVPRLSQPARMPPAETPTPVAPLTPLPPRDLTMPVTPSLPLNVEAPAARRRFVSSLPAVRLVEAIDAGPGGGGGAGGSGDHRAGYISNPKPHYPPDAVAKGQEGIVVLRVSIQEDGGVDDVKLQRSSGFSSLDEAAVSTVRDRWRFAPARQGGTNIASQEILWVRFLLSERGM